MELKTSFQWTREIEVRELEDLRHHWDVNQVDAGLAEEAIERGWAYATPELSQQISQEFAQAKILYAKLDERVQYWRLHDKPVIDHWCEAHLAVCAMMLETTKSEGKQGPVRAICLNDIIRDVGKLQRNEIFAFHINRHYLPDYQDVFTRL